MSWKKRFSELGITIPEAPTPAGSYVPAILAGNYVYTSGQLPVKDGKLLYTGKVSTGAQATVTPDQAQQAAQQSALNALAAISTVTDIENIKRIIKVVGFVASESGFTGQPAVINGASDFFVTVFGDAGKHARSAVGVAELPLGAPVEVEVIAELAS